MLSYLRQRKGSRLIKGLLIALAISFFSGFGLLGYCSRKEKASQRMANTVASIGDEYFVTQYQLERAVNAKNRKNARPENEAEAAKQRKEILDALINQQLILREAKLLGLTASDAEVSGQVVSLFQKDGNFLPDFYQNYLSSIGMTQEEFENEIRNEIIARKLEDAVAGGVVVTDDDVQQLYMYQNEQVQLQLIQIDPEKLIDIPKPTEADIKARYDKDPEGFTIPEKRRVGYACITADQVVSPKDITEGDINDYYNKAKDFRFAIKPREVKARKIFFPTPMGTPEEQKSFVNDQAQSVLTDAKAGTASFEELAKKYSGDTATAQNGGDMGWVNVKEAGLPAGRVLQQLKVGEISDVATGFDGFYIFKVEEERPGSYKPLSSVRGDVINFVREMKGRTKSKEAAQQIVKKVGEGTTFAEAAKIATAEVKLSGLFEEKDETLDKIEGSSSMVAAAYKLWEVDAVSDVISLAGKSCVMQLTEIEEEHAATFEEAIPLVEKELLAERRKEAAKKIGEEIAASIKAGTPFEKAIVGKAASESILTDYFVREKESVPKVGYSPDLVNAAFALPMHNPISEKVFEVNGKFYLVKVLGKKEADPAGYAAKINQLKGQLIFDRQKEIVDSWVESLKKTVKITIREEPAVPAQDENL